MLSEHSKSEDVAPEPEWLTTVRMFNENKAAVLGFIVICCIMLVGLLGPSVLNVSPFAIVGPPPDRAR